jgi:hypothetical protein
VVSLPDGSRARGLADGDGRATVLFPYPEPALVTGPAVAGPLAGQTWTLGLRAFHGTGTPPVPVAGPDGVPDLCDVLGQHPAGLLATATDPLTEIALGFGRDTVVRTAGRSTLLLTTSP